MLARIAAVVGVVVLLGAGALIIKRVALGGDGHTLRAGFDSVVQITEGQDVRLAGRKVGKVDEVTLVDGQPVLDLRISDSAAWPLPRGTSARIRYGSTTSYLLRYVELLPGKPSAPDLEDDAMLARAENITPFELDRAYRIFRGGTKKDASQLLGRLGRTFGNRKRELRRGLRAAPGGLDESAGLLGELSSNEASLRTLVRSGDRTLGALAARDRDLRGLISNAAETFDEFAEHTEAQQQALERAPEAFDTTTTTLARLDTSLDRLDGLVTDLKPATGPLRTFARESRGAFAELRSVAPLATTTLRTGTETAPGIRRLLDRGTPFLPRFGNVLTQVDPMLDCFRPYGPEITGFVSTWAGFAKNYDTDGHYARSFSIATNANILPGTASNSEQVVAATELEYAMPRPPGLNAGNPWFLPQCGAGPDSLDASKDPEGAGK